MNFNNVPINEELRLGADGSTAEEMLAEINLNTKTFYGAAVIGHLKKLAG